MSKFEYISANDLRNIMDPPIGLTKARSIIKEVNKDIEDSGCLVPCNYRAPKEMVLKKLGLKGE